MAAPKQRTAAPKRRTATSKRRPAAKKRKPLPPWLLLGGGLLLGIASALAFNVAKEVEWDIPWGETPSPKTSSSESATPPRYSFYTILPKEVVVPDREPPAGKKEAPDGKKAPPPPEGVYYIQAGSFRKLNEANGMRARVILLGAEASIQSVTLGDDIWHRVRVGPYKDLARLREVRQRLRDNKIDTFQVRVDK